MDPTQLSGIAPGSNGGLATITPVAPVFDPKAAVGALQDVITARKAATSAQIGAMEKNSALSQRLMLQQNVIDQSNNDVYQNMEKINRWSRISPTIVNILSKFDPSFSSAEQALRLKVNQAQIDQSTRQTQGQIAINNATPALLDQQAQLAQQDYSLFKDTWQIANESRTLDQKDVELEISNQRLRMDMDEATKKNVEFNLGRMTTDQKIAALNQAKKGQGDWSQFPGVLEHSINNDLKSEADYEDAVTNVAAKRSDLADKNMMRLVNRMPIDVLQSNVQDAITSGKGGITVGKLQIPLDIAMKGLDEQTKTLTSIQNGILNDSAAQIQNDLEKTTSAAAMMTSFDPRAGREIGLLAQMRQKTDPQNMVQMKQFHQAITAAQTRLEGYAKDASKVYRTPEAQAAIEQAVKSGEFTPEGADAVVNATAGNFAASKTALHSGAYTILNNKLAERIAAQNFDGAPKMGSAPSMAQSMSMLAFAMRSSQAKSKLPELTDELMADPTLNAQLSASIDQDTSFDALKSSLFELGQPQNASPVWKDVLQIWDKENQFNNADGSTNPEKIVQYLERKSIETGGRIDYNQQLLSTLQKRVNESGTGTLADPRYTMADRALETKLFGTNPKYFLVKGFFDRMNKSTAQVKRDMEARRSQDMTGKTTKQSLGVLGAVHGMIDTPVSPEEAAAASNPPSATGAALSVDQVRKLYGK